MHHYIDKPTIAAVNGTAFGGGTELALASDLVVAEERAKFGLPEVKRGLIAAAGGVFRIVDHLPRKVAMELLFTGEPMSSADALKWGLINQVVPDGTAVDAALALAERITVNAPLAVWASKRVANGVDDGVIVGDEAGWDQDHARNRDPDSFRGRQGRTAGVCGEAQTRMESEVSKVMKRLVFEPEHEQLRETARQFLEKECAPYVEKWESERLVDRESYVAAGKYGLIGFNMPEEYGGGGVDDFRFNAVIVEEFSKFGPATPGLSLQNDIVGPYFASLATDEQKERWLPGYITGELIGAIAMTEPGAGSDLAGIKTIGGARRRRLDPQRLQDIHLRGHQQRSGDRRRPHRPRGGAQGLLAAGRRAWHGGVRPRAQARQDGPACRRHRRTALRERPRARKQPPRSRRAAASTT